MRTKIIFVHTPMAAAVVAERQLFWRNFDIRYHAAHPGLHHMKQPLWELPHWMHWLGGVLVTHGFTSLEVLDLAWCANGLATLDADQVISSIRSHPGDVYLFSPMTPNLPLALRIAQLIKVTYPEAIVVFGGVVATPLHSELAADPHVDYVVVGRGDIALPALLFALQGNCPIESVGNLAFQSKNGELRSPTWYYPPLSLEDLPEPKVDLFPSETGENLRYLRQVYALGCPYGCSFCTIQTIRQRQNFFPVSRVLEEIRSYRAHYGEHHNIYFGDETFGLNIARTEELCNALEADGTISYDCQTRLRCLGNATLRKLLNRSGCRWVEVGLETKSQSSQDHFKQRQKVAEAEEILDRARDDGLAVCSFMVNGFPDQTVDDMRSAVDWVCELIGKGLLQASYFGALVPYPGSDFFERPNEFGMKIRHRNFEYYNEDLPPVYDSIHASSEAIHEVFLDGLTMIGQAMGQDHDAMLTRGTPEDYGQFWASSHI